MRPKLRDDCAGSWSIRNPPQDPGDLWASMQAGVPWARKITVTQKCSLGVRSFPKLYPHIASNSMGQLLGEGKWGLKSSPQDFPGSSVVKNLPANAREMGSIPDLGRFHMPWSNEARGHNC